MTELVRAAAEADIGIHPIPGTTNQTVHCLPNKFFEYVMAGLALCVTDLPEKRRLVQMYRLGRTIATPTPKGIAAAVNGFGRQEVTRARQNSLEAAKVLCWEHEKHRLLTQYALIAQERLQSCGC